MRRIVLDASGYDRLRRFALANNAYYFDCEVAALASETSTRRVLDGPARTIMTALGAIEVIA